MMVETSPALKLSGKSESIRELDLFGLRKKANLDAMGRLGSPVIDDSVTNKQIAANETVAAKNSVTPSLRKAGST